MPPRVNSDQSRILEISGTQLTTTQVAAVARDSFPVQLSQEPDIRKKILASRALLEEKLRRGEIIYCVNTGLGGNVRFILPVKDLARWIVTATFIWWTGPRI
jgi:histidine ammonia-lyase